MSKYVFSKQYWIHIAAIIGLIVAIVTISFVVELGVRQLAHTFQGTWLGKRFATVSAPSPESVSLYKPAIDYEKAVIAAVKKASPAVVSITVSKNVPVISQCPVDPLNNLPPEFRDFFGGAQFFAPCQKGIKFQEVGGGSGFIISPDGLIITNKHVVSDSKASYTVLTNDGKKYDAQVLARDPVQDLAVVKIEGSNMPVVELGDSDGLELGQTAIAIGNALAEFRNTVSVGSISGLARTVTASGENLTETISGVIQTDAAINPGNSGGPLLNLQGQVVGINTAVASDAQNVGFAIPINQAKKDIASVKANGKIEVAFLGVRYRMIDAQIAKDEKLAVDHGALIEAGKGTSAIEKNSPAEKAGLKGGDIITAVNGKRIDEAKPLQVILSQYGVGDVITLTIRRGDTELTTQATLEKRPDIK